MREVWWLCIFVLCSAEGAVNLSTPRKLPQDLAFAHPDFITHDPSGPLPPFQVVVPRVSHQAGAPPPLAEESEDVTFQTEDLLEVPTENGIEDWKSVEEIEDVLIASTRIISSTTTQTSTNPPTNPTTTTTIQTTTTTSTTSKPIEVRKENELTEQELKVLQKPREVLDLLKKSSKFAAFGVKNNKEKEEIHNTDGSNPQLPPFAFSEDEEEIDEIVNDQSEVKLAVDALIRANERPFEEVTKGRKIIKIETTTRIITTPQPPTTTTEKRIIQDNAHAKFSVGRNYIKVKTIKMPNNPTHNIRSKTNITTNRRNSDGTEDSSTPSSVLRQLVPMGIFFNADGSRKLNSARTDDFLIAMPDTTTEIPEISAEKGFEEMEEKTTRKRRKHTTTTTVAPHVVAIEREPGEVDATNELLHIIGEAIHDEDERTTISSSNTVIHRTLLPTLLSNVQHETLNTPLLKKRGSGRLISRKTIKLRKLPRDQLRDVRVRKGVRENIPQINENIYWKEEKKRLRKQKELILEEERRLLHEQLEQQVQQQFELELTKRLEEEREELRKKIQKEEDAKKIEAYNQMITQQIKTQRQQQLEVNTQYQTTQQTQTLDPVKYFMKDGVLYRETTPYKRFILDPSRPPEQQIQQYGYQNAIRPESFISTQQSQYQQQTTSPALNNIFQQPQTQQTIQQQQQQQGFQQQSNGFHPFHFQHSVPTQPLFAPIPLFQQAPPTNNLFGLTPPIQQAAPIQQTQSIIKTTDISGTEERLLPINTMMAQ